MEPLYQAKTPSITATLGLPGSASTWVFNVARELTIAQYGEDRVQALFSDTAPSARPDRHLVVKSHCPDRSWHLWAASVGVRMILTVRDPRDAMVSLMRRFNYDIATACGTVRGALRSVAEAAEAGHPVLRFEDRFFDQPATLDRLACHLGITVADAEAARIFAAYATERVRQFAVTLDTLPAHRVRLTGLSSRYDDVTQIHHTHIGDQAVGKWRDRFDEGQRRLVNSLLTPWLRIFGYEEA